jgi:hypothetical protein
MVVRIRIEQFLGILDTTAPSVADPDSGSGAFLTPKKIKFRIQDPG